MALGLLLELTLQLSKLVLGGGLERLEALLQGLEPFRERLQLAMPCQVFYASI